MASPPSPPQAYRTAGRLIVTALLVLAVAGCASRSRGPRLPEPEPEPEPVVQSSRLPAGETRNRVAVLVPLTGANAALGQSILNAANLALLDTGGQRIRITAYDTSGGAVAAANEALAEGSGLILGPLLAADVRAVAPIARRADVPVITFSNDVSVAGDGVYVMGVDPRQTIGRVVAFARSRGATRFGGLVTPGDYGERAGEALAGALEGVGGQLVGIHTADRTAAGVRAAATRLNTQGRTDAVLLADIPRVLLAAVPILRQSVPQPRLLGVESWAAEGNLGATPGLRGSWFAAPSDASFNAFRTRYRARYNVVPYRLATLGYDAVLLTVRIAADWPLGRDFPERELRGSTGFVGVDGAFRFGRDGVAERALEVREVSAGGTTIVSPAPRGFD